MYVPGVSQILAHAPFSRTRPDTLAPELMMTDAPLEMTAPFAAALRIYRIPSTTMVSSARPPLEMLRKPVFTV